LLSFAVFYGLVSNSLVGGLFSRHRFDDLAPALAAITMMSAMVSAAGLMSLNLWANVVEIFRWRDGHGSYRVGRLPWGHQWIELLVGGVVLFWLIALTHVGKSRTTNRQAIAPDL